MRDQGASNGTLGRAVVLGAGIGGLVAARVLSDHFDQVTIVEQDHLPEGLAGRTGAPQAQHLHVLLQRGKLALEALFPGLQAELASAGAPLVNLTRDMALLSPEGWSMRFPSGIEGRSCSRGLLEWSIRQRLVGSKRGASLQEPRDGRFDAT